MWMIRSTNPKEKTESNKCSKELKEFKLKIDNETFRTYLENLSPDKHDDYSL